MAIYTINYTHCTATGTIMDISPDPEYYNIYVNLNTWSGIENTYDITSNTYGVSQPYSQVLVFDENDSTITGSATFESVFLEVTFYYEWVSTDPDAANYFGIDVNQPPPSGTFTEEYVHDGDTFTEEYNFYESIALTCSTDNISTTSDNGETYILDTGNEVFDVNMDNIYPGGFNTPITYKAKLSDNLVYDDVKDININLFVNSHWGSDYLPCQWNMYIDQVRLKLYTAATGDYGWTFANNNGVTEIDCTDVISRIFYNETVNASENTEITGINVGMARSSDVDVVGWILNEGLTPIRPSVSTSSSNFDNYPESENNVTVKLSPCNSIATVNDVSVHSFVSGPTEIYVLGVPLYE